MFIVLSGEVINAEFVSPPLGVELAYQTDRLPVTSKTALGDLLAHVVSSPFRAFYKDKEENEKESVLSSHNEMVKEQLLHMLFGTMIFVVLGGIAVGLDLAAAGVLKLGVSEFTHKSIEYAAHSMLVLDLVLFGLYLVRSSATLVKEMFK